MTSTATRTRRRATRVLTGTAAVALLLLGATACGTASAGDDKHPDHRTFALPGRTLTIDSDDSALEVVAADANPAGKIEVTRWWQGSVAIGSDPKVSWAMDGDRLKLRMRCSGVIADCSAKHRIEVPRGVTVKVEDGDGSVRAQGFADALNIRTHDGSVHVTDTTGPLTLHSGDGSLHAEVSSRQVHATTGDGSVHLELGAVPDLVDSTSGDGSVTIALPTDGGAKYRVTTKTGDGSVHVSVPRDSTSSHVVTAHTGDGKVTVRNAN
ncbi:DUF4097 family beta strand repeat-containing protein [Streptomyces sp. NPDC096142]|uniref:DUF4097 family beta strand repeat-containing protein n=1 Tax=Streptomyces sp. NPDC096142 TaxID=3366077 RepID=UPI00382FA421